MTIPIFFHCSAFLIKRQKLISLFLSHRIFFHSFSIEIFFIKLIFYCRKIFYYNIICYCVLLSYIAVIRPELTYGCRVWTMMAQTNKKSFENKILRKIPDNKLNRWRWKTNAKIREMMQNPKLTSYVNGQRIQRSGYAMRRNEETTMWNINHWGRS